MNDRFGTPLVEGDVVVQNVTKGDFKLRRILEINPDRHPGKVRLGGNLSTVWDYRPSWVQVGNVAKYFNQEVSQ